jgi:hypothetical protein
MSDKSKEDKSFVKKIKKVKSKKKKNLSKKITVQK